MVVVVTLLLVLVYFLPSLVAIARDHQSWFEIVTCNLLLGWTVLGRIVAFIWSLTAARWQTTIVLSERFHAEVETEQARFKAGGGV
jgi:Superinfection immunity protein